MVMADDDAPSETSTRRSKRTRVQAQRHGHAAAESGGKQSGPSDDQVDREESFDDYDDSPPRPKRGRSTSEGTSAAAASLRLIEVVKGNGKLIPDVVKVWADKYEKDPKPAMVELLVMLFEACGAKYHLDEEFLDKTSVDDVVFELVTLAGKGIVEDYQNSKKKEFQNFKDNLVKFWDMLVKECSNGPLFDSVLFEKITDYVIALSCTPPRVYRQVASLVGLSLVTSFVSVANVLGAQRETTQRQLNAEKKKRAEGPRVDSLNKRLSAIQPKINILEELVRKIFQGLFVHRYRDIDPNIRTTCIQSLGYWNLSYPSLFLQDRYLKYLGWTLNDKNAGVRKASVHALQNLYKVDDNIPSLSLFTERFSNRIIELADDIDISVAVSAIGLINQLLSNQLLSNDDLGPIYDLLVDYSPEIRRAIGELVFDHLIAQRTSSSQSGEDNDAPEVHLGRMLQILREFSTEPILSTYVIDDIWEYMEAMKDWKTIVSMLLDENPSIELTDEDATNLIRLLCASAKKAVGERIVPATDNRKQHYTKAQRDAFESNRKTITIVMMKNYPQLLRKYMADKTKISPLTEIVLIMNLELYSLKRQEQTFKNVLQLVKEAFFKHGEKDALRSCVRAINFCSTESKGELQDFAKIKSKELEDELITKLKSAIKDVMDGDDDYSLLVNMKRLYELQLSRPVPFENLHDDIVSSLPNLKNTDEEVLSFLLLNLYLHVAWSLHTIVNSKTVSESSISSLLRNRATLFEQLEYYLNPSPEFTEERKFGNQLAARVCVILAEVWCLFRDSNFSSTKLESLGYTADRSTIQKFWKLCEQQLNSSDGIEEDDPSKRDAENKEYIEETNRDAIMIAAAKLVATEVVFKDYLGPEIISHFVMHGASVAEIVKHLISVLKKRDDDIPSIFVEALKRAHHRHLTFLRGSADQVLVNKSLMDFHDLSVRLSGVFAGSARNKHRLDVLKIVKDGIDYAFADAPKQLSFLEGAVLHFVSKLPTQDIVEILRDVQKRTENVNTDEDPSGWRPYFTFVDTVGEKHLKNEGLQDDKEKRQARQRGRPSKRRNLQGKRLFDEEQDSSADEDSISGSDRDNHDDEDKQDDDEDDDAPLIHSIRSSAKLRSLKVPRRENASKQ
uniref:Cohesin subunit SA-3 n=1 Tax=Kalanchoe fedtschenkoi TaxID=63787 RepID=A0A7N0ULZ7_KALFE